MAHHRITGFDAFDHTGPANGQTPLTEKNQDGSRAEAMLSDSGNTLSAPGRGTTLSDLALDLVLNEIAHQARLATNATGAAIATTRGGEILCRATSGATAPQVAVCLSARSGMAGACQRTGDIQRCVDSETDSRVDAVSCRRLGVRSILIVPVQRNSEAPLGVIEVFCARSDAFGDRDVLTLQALSRRIVANVDLAGKIVTQASMAPSPKPPSADPAQFKSRKPEFSPLARKAGTRILAAPASIARGAGQWHFRFPALRFGSLSGTRELKASTRYRRLPLTLVVFGLTLLLGWMLGRAGKQRAAVVTHVNSQVASPSPTRTHVTQLPQATSDAGLPVRQLAVESVSTAPVPSSTKNANSNANTVRLEITRAHAPTRAEGHLSGPKRATDETSSDGLVVYEDGKVVFDVKPSKRSSELADPAVETPGPVASVPGSKSKTAPVQVSQEVANAHLVQRVEPQYPDKAREQRIQGPVVLDIVVGKDGTVQGLSMISGDLQLMLAAADAVRQWHFEPFLQNGRPVKFESRITVDFTLP